MVLNTIVAESLDYIATSWRRPPVAIPSKLTTAVQKVVQDVIKEHKAIVFNGDNYSAEWHNEAEKRGLPNFHNTVDALPALIAAEEHRDVREVRRALRAGNAQPL